MFNRVVSVQLMPQLIEVGNLQIDAEFDRAGRGFQLTEQEFDQRGLPGAIWTDYADAITTHDGC